MKIGIVLIVFLGFLIFALKITGAMSASPFLTFLFALGLTMIIIMFALVAFAKSQKDRRS